MTVRAAIVAFVVALAGGAHAGPGVHFAGQDQAARVAIESQRDNFVLACAKQHLPLDRVELHVTIDVHQHATATTAGNDPFTRCIADVIARMHFQGVPDDGFRLQAYAFDLVIDPASPQGILERRFQSVPLDTSCTPRPGAIPTSAVIELTDDVHVITTPANPEVASCLEQHIRHQLADFAGITKLHARVERLVPPHLDEKLIRSELAGRSMDFAHACYPRVVPPKTPVHVSIAAMVGDKDFTVTVDMRDRVFASCMHDRVLRWLHDLAEVTRVREDGAAEQYFRIDAPVNAEFRFSIGNDP